MRKDAESRAIEIAAQLSIVEIALGSLVHSLKIPFGGHILSLNQGLFLCRAASASTERSEAYQSTILISGVAATLKSLSPAGNKLGPMISISMQGLLYSFGIGTLGRGLLGQALGMALLSPWAFVQPVLTLYLFYGSDLTHAAQTTLLKLQKTTGISPQSFMTVLGAVIALKAVAAVFIPFVLEQFGAERTDAQAEKLIHWARARSNPAPTLTASHRSALIGAGRDLLRPLFLLSLALMGVFFFLSETSQAPLIWKLLRPISVAFLFFYFSRSPWIPLLTKKLSRVPGMARFSAAVARTSHLLNKN